MEIDRVGLIGMGQMGRGIAEVCALSGYDVIATDSDPETLEISKTQILNDLKKLEKKNKIDRGKINKAMEKILLSQDLSEFSGCDLIIEAATEKVTFKVPKLLREPAKWIKLVKQ